MVMKYKKVFAWNNLQMLIYHKTEPNSIFTGGKNKLTPGKIKL